MQITEKNAIIIKLFQASVPLLFPPKYIRKSGKHFQWLIKKNNLGVNNDSKPIVGKMHHINYLHSGVNLTLICCLLVLITLLVIKYIKDEGTTKP